MIFVSVWAGKEGLVILRDFVGSFCETPAGGETMLADCFSKSKEIARICPMSADEFEKAMVLLELTHLSNQTVLRFKSIFVSRFFIDACFNIGKILGYL
jgi:hypothetical protein